MRRLRGRTQFSVDLGLWVVIPDPSDPGHPLYHFSVKFVFDRLSVPFAILSFVLSGTIGRVRRPSTCTGSRGSTASSPSTPMFLLGMVVAALAGTVETLFTGWELVGLSSALLIAFFQERPAPPRNGLRVWVVYRVSDVRPCCWPRCSCTG